MTKPSAQVSEASGNEATPSRSRKATAKRPRRWLRWIAWPLVSILLLVGIAWGAFNLSPWPAVWITRYFFEQGSTSANDKLAPLVPDTVSAMMDLSYDPDDDDAFLDVYYPSRLDTQPEQLPVIVWVHGGAWVATGKEHMENYLRILAGEGYFTVGIGYTLAPDAAYPTQAQQVLKALEYLESDSERFNIDRNHYILGGDSAGSQIAAQVATVITNPSYASATGLTASIDAAQLTAMLLYCGPFDPAQLLDPEGIRASALWPFIDKILWAYLGTHDYDEVLELAAPLASITSDFPASFISVGNDDPLKAHSTALAKRLAELGVSHETLFYADDHTPALGHEYQFALAESEDARRSLELSMNFITEQIALKQSRLLASSEE